ncbi:MAG: carbon-nitrogen hydrolase family protein, partial [Cyanobacteriota bacterium]
MQQFTAACAQFFIEPLNIQANIEKALNFVDKAIVEHQPQLIVFPESVTTGFGINCSIEELYNIIDY